MTPYNGKLYLASTHVPILISLDSVILFCNLVANALVILITVRTTQLSNTAFKVIFNLGLAGIGQTIFGQTFFVIVVITGTTCSIQYTVHFVILFFGYTINYTIGVIGFDCYLRVKYMARYATILTKKKAHLIVFFIDCFALARSSVIVTGFLAGKFKFIRALGDAIDYFSMSIIAFMKMASVIAIKIIVASSGNQEVMEETRKAIIKLSSRITIVFLIFSITSVTMLVIYNILRGSATGMERKIVEFLQILGYLIALINSLASAILFLLYNTKVKFFFRSIFHSLFLDVDTSSQQNNDFSLSVMPRTCDDTKSN